MTEIKVDIVSDVVCPWCYVGKRNLEIAAGAASEVSLSISWRPYQLDPTIPPQGMDREAYMLAKFRDPERIRAAHDRLLELGRATGIDFRFDAIRIAPNTLDAHRLIRWAGGKGAQTQGEAVRRLFESYFTQGLNVADHRVLCDIAEACGMDRGIVRDLLESDADRGPVSAEIDQARRMGVTGVPCFIFEGKHAVMGAQPPDMLADALRQLAAMKQAQA